MTFKQKFTEAIADLLASVSMTPAPSRTVVSQNLFDAIREIEVELTKDRTDWHLMAALTGVKSYLCTVQRGRTSRESFWSEERGEDEVSVYSILDGLHFRAASHVGVLPSGMTEFRGTCEGIAVHSGEIDTAASPTSPTLRLLAEELRDPR